MSIKLNCRFLEKFVREQDLIDIAGEVDQAQRLLGENREQAAGNKYHGWLTLPADYDKEEFALWNRSGSLRQLF